MKLYSRQFSTQQMGVQTSHSIHAKTPKKNQLLGDARGHSRHYPRSMYVKRRGDHRRESHAGPYPSAAIHTTDVFRVEFYGVSEGEKRDDDFRASHEFEV